MPLLSPFRIIEMKIENYIFRWFEDIQVVIKGL